MSEHATDAGRQRRWIVQMRPRSPDEEHRAATPLELFFDLVFVVAIAQAGIALHHGLAEAHVAEATVSFVAVFFAIWWAWINFTWFASAYDCGDIPYRLATFMQLTGALILAAGIQRAFEQRDFAIVAAGYVVMRMAMVAQYIRAGHSNPAGRTTAYRYAVGVSILQVGWVALLFFQGRWWHPIVFVALAIGELLVPVWGERAGPTTWHAGHITERYGLFTIIVLGESILAASLGIQSAVEAAELGADLISIIGGGLMIIFSMWWIYFDWPMADLLRSLRMAFVWGYGHFFIFAAAAAVGVGLAVQIDEILHHTELGPVGAGAAVAVPVAIYLIGIWALHLRSHTGSPAQILLLPAVALLVLLTSFAGVQAALLTGLLLVGLLVIKLTSRYRSNAQVTG